MKSIKGTETEKNLLKAFAGESEARNRYTYFAGVAKKAGYEQIAAIFLETADNEKEHAKVFLKLSARLPPWSSTMKPATSSWLKMCAKAGFLPRRRKSSGSAATAAMYIPVPLPPRYVRLVRIPRHSLKNWRTTFNNLFPRNMIGAGFTS